MKQVQDSFHIAQQLLMKDPDSTGKRNQSTMSKAIGKEVIALLREQGHRVTAFYRKYSVTVYIHLGDN